MARKPIHRLLLLAVFILSLPPGPARADAIDGHWCHADGRKFSIDGARIVTPAGTQTTGEYDRHAFTYNVPAGDPGAGSTVSMDLIDENTVHLWIGVRTSGSGPMQIWRRCSDVTS